MVKKKATSSQIQTSATQEREEILGKYSKFASLGAPREGKSFYNVPDSTASNAVMEVLGAGEKIADLPARKKQISRSSSVEVLESGNKRQLTVTTEKSQVTIELADIDKITGSNKAAKKLFILSLIKANEQAIFDGELGRDYISFPLQELVDNGFYSRIQSARKGFKDGMDALTSLKVKGRIQKSKRITSSIEALEVLFTGANIKNGQCTVYMNPRISWSFIAQYFTILPKYYFALSNRSSDLLYYIFFLARQNVKEIETRGYFTISFKAIHAKLLLPSPVGNTRPQQTIKDPIEDAIAEIENNHAAYYGDQELELLPVYDDGASVKEFLDNGYLEVRLKGSFAENFIAISRETEKKIAEREKSNARITEKAIAINMAKKMEAEEN